MKLMLSCKKGIVVLFLAIAVLVPEAGLMAWSEHPLLSHPVLSTMPEVRDAKAIPVERIEAFLGPEAKKIEKLLVEEEAWARANLQSYAPLPDSLAFKADGGSGDIRLQFCRAIRINPAVKFPVYLQLIPGQGSKGMALLRPSDISFLRDTSDWQDTTFAELKSGEMASPLDVVSSATDDPDLLGLDIGLFEDNGTDFGKDYGFGRQPFGNPNLEYGSQAPFHMGFYHESEVIYFFAGFLKRSYPEYRIRLYKQLARLAFETGHPYWGWRFTGWGLHYLADLAQPYHATALPGVGTARALWINTMDMIGLDRPKAEAVQLVSNRHTAIEKFAQVIMQRALRKGETDHPLLAALRSAPDVPPYEDTVPRHAVAKLAHDRAEEADRTLEECMPAKFVSDPGFELGTSPERERIVEKILAENGREALDRQILLVRDLLIPFASHGRSYVRAVIPSP